MSKYQKTKIYTIRSYENDEIYIGSTVETLSVRMSKHRSAYKRYLTGNHGYTSSFEILRYPTAYIELLEQYPCSNADEKHAREGFHIRRKDCVNKNIAGRTRKEYYMDHSDVIKQKSQKYRLENRDVLKQYNQKYRIDNHDVLKQYSKKYRLENRDVLKQYSKKYRLENRDVLKQYSQKYYINNADALKEKNFCTVCCGSYTRMNKASHMRSKKHNDMCLNRLFLP